MRKLRSAEAPRGVPSLCRIRFVVPEVAIVDIDNEVRGVKAMPGGIALPTIALGRGRF